MWGTGQIIRVLKFVKIFSLECELLCVPILLLCCLPVNTDFGSATSRAKFYNTTAEIAEEEENIRRNTTPGYRAPEVIQQRYIL
jgi:hypothetical protein